MRGHKADSKFFPRSAPYVPSASEEHACSLIRSRKIIVKLARKTKLNQTKPNPEPNRTEANETDKNQNKKGKTKQNTKLNPNQKLKQARPNNGPYMLSSLDEPIVTLGYTAVTRYGFAQNILQSEVCLFVGGLFFFGGGGGG